MTKLIFSYSVGRLSRPHSQSELPGKEGGGKRARPCLQRIMLFDVRQNDVESAREGTQPTNLELTQKWANVSHKHTKKN